MEKQLLTVADVCETTSLGRSTIYIAIRRGELESVKIGAARRVRPEAVVEYVARLREQSALGPA